MSEICTAEEVHANHAKSGGARLLYTLGVQRRLGPCATACAILATAEMRQHQVSPTANRPRRHERPLRLAMSPKPTVSFRPALALAECLLSTHPGREADRQKTTQPGHSSAIRRTARVDPTWSYAELAGDPGTGHSAPGGTDGCAPMVAVQPSGVGTQQRTLLALGQLRVDGHRTGPPTSGGMMEDTGRPTLQATVRFGLKQGSGLAYASDPVKRNVCQRGPPIFRTFGRTSIIT
jgi:hypothetical protein